MPDWSPITDLGRTVKGSWYSQLPQYGWRDPQDRPGSNALGVPDTQQGIALPSRATLGQYFRVTWPDGRTSIEQQTDVGPGRSTGRGVDISAAAAHRMGYTPATFQTDANYTVEPLEPGGYVPGYGAGTATAAREPQGALARFAAALPSGGAGGRGFSGLSGPFGAGLPAAAAPFVPQPVQFAPLGQLGLRRFA